MIKKMGVIILLVLLFSIPATTLSRALELDYPVIGGESLEEGVSVEDAVQYIFTFAIFAGTVAVFAMLIYGGFLYITSVGNAQKTKQGVERISSALLGLSALLLFVLVITVINPNLLNIHLSLEGFEDPPVIDHPDFPQLTGKDNIIVEENPFGYYLEEKLNTIEQREAVDEDLRELENILGKEWQFNPTVIGVSGVNKYLQSITEECSCDMTEARCADTRFLGIPLGCDGDPCDVELAGGSNVKDIMKEIKEINEEMTKSFLLRRENILRQKTDLERSVRRFQELEQRLTDCRPQGVTMLNQQMERFSIFRDLGMGLTTKIHKEMDLFTGGGNPLTFYCTVGGTLMETDVFPREGISLISPLKDVEDMGRFSCSNEYNVGKISDKVRELTIIQISKMEILADNIENIVSEIQTISEYTSAIGVQNCTPSCNCIPNPLVWLTGNPCLQIVGGCSGQASPYGGVKEAGKENRGKILKTVERVKEIEEEIYSLTEKIKGYMIEISLLLGERVVITDNTVSLKEHPGGSNTGHTATKGQSYLAVITESGWIKIKDDLMYNKNTETGWIPETSVTAENREMEMIKEGVWRCYTTQNEITDDRWIVLDARRALGNYGPNEMIITNPNPRNLFCCNLPQYPLPDIDPLPYSDYNIIPAESFIPLEWSKDDNCIEGWDCTIHISLPKESDKNQYDDASARLKEQLSCMRERLDSIQKSEEMGLDGDGEIISPIGKISYISDHRLYSPINSCSFVPGPFESGGCSFSHETVYGQKRISPHYGGNDCNSLLKSFAVSFTDTENAEYIIGAAKACNPSSYISYQTPNAYAGENPAGEEKIKPHLQISIAGAYNCGTD